MPLHVPFLACLSMLGILFFSLGCGYKGNSHAKTEDEHSSAPTKTPEKVIEVAMPGKVDRNAKDPSVLAFEAAKQKQKEVTKTLEEAAGMIKTSNLEGALRLVQRVQQENSLDPNVTMQTNYMQAMIFYRQKDSPKRKEAMNQMLKSMEKLQKDPRFRQAYQEGMDSVEVIKQSLEKMGSKYENK